jgi:hypothetical protein
MTVDKGAMTCLDSRFLDTIAAIVMCVYLLANKPIQIQVDRKGNDVHEVGEGILAKREDPQSQIRG